MTKTRLVLKVEGTSVEGDRALNEYAISPGFSPKNLIEVKRIARDMAQIKTATIVETVVVTTVTETKILD